MELKVDIGFDQLINAIKQLPPDKIDQLKAELTKKKLSGTDISPSTNFQQFLLNGPIMDDAQYEYFKEIRNKLNKWRTK